MASMTIEPTDERYEAPIDGKLIPVRIWRGKTEGGIPLEAYVLSVTPQFDEDAERLGTELGLRPTRETYKVDLRGKR